MAEPTEEEEYVSKLERKYDLDNRDMNTTWLWLEFFESPEGYVEVDPWDLVCNAIENLGLAAKEESRLLKKVTDLKEEVEHVSMGETNNED